MFQDRVLDLGQAAVAVPDAASLDVTGALQLPDRGADAVHAVLP